MRFSNRWATTVRSASEEAMAGSRVAGAASRHTRRVMVSRGWAQPVRASMHSTSNRAMYRIRRFIGATLLTLIWAPQESPGRPPPGWRG